MPVDVSVIVPFFNPGANIEDCLQSLLDQTLPRDRFDVILVDDGSTDGSGDRVKAWVSRHPDLMSLHHIPASGGPGRPRNVAMDRSQARFIQFLDSDDTLEPRALERMLEIADASDADVVVGKLSSDFRGIHHPMFRHTVTRCTVDDFPLMRNLTVCKMFRREFLTAHGVRFPEGPHYIEDQYLCVRAYAHARSVAVVADTACYLYRRRRTGGRNFGDTTIVLADYYRELAEILDVVDGEISNPVTALAFQSRFYRNEMLGRLRGQAMLSYHPDYRRELVTTVRDLANARFPEAVHASLPVFQRAQSRLLLDGDLDGLVAFARRLGAIRLHATTTTPRWQDGSLVVDVDAPICSDDKPLTLERDGEGWLLPQWFASGVNADDRRLLDNDELDLDLATVARSNSALWSATEGLMFDIDDAGIPRIGGTVDIDPRTVMGGAALTPGLWNLRLRVIVGGLSRTSPLRPAPGTAPGTSTWLTTSGQDDRCVTAYWDGRTPALTLDVGEWSHARHDLVADEPGPAPTLRRGRHLAIKTAGLRGPIGTRSPANLILEALNFPALGVVKVAAELTASPDGATIEARIPHLPAGPARWGVWLRIGDLGGSPPRRLSIELTQTRFGRLRLAAA